MRKWQEKGWKRRRRKGWEKGWGRDGEGVGEGPLGLTGRVRMHWDQLGENWERWERTGVALRGTRNYSNFMITSCTILTKIFLPTWKCGLHSGAANI